MCGGSSPCELDPIALLAGDSHSRLPRPVLSTAVPPPQRAPLREPPSLNTLPLRVWELAANVIQPPPAPSFGQVFPMSLSR